MMQPESAACTIQFDLSRIRMERIIRKYTADDMGRAMGISANAYYKKERGTTNIPVNELCLILEFLEIPQADIPKFFIYNQLTESEKGS